MFSIVSLFALVASACADGLHQHLIPPSPSVATLGAHTLLSNGVVGPSLYSSRLVGPSVLSVPTVSRTLVAPKVLAAQHVTVARPASVAVERVHYGSVPSVSVVNEPTSIVAPGKPITGHSYTSEVRHDTKVAAPLIASYAVPAAVPHILEAPAVSAQIVEKSDYAVPSVAHIPSTIVSAPQVYATGPAYASVVSGPASVRGYTTETGRTDLISEVRLRAASIPATVVHDTLVESAPVYSSVISQPLLSTHGYLGAKVLPTLWKK